jgi:predicted small lipoprotein YifL
MAPNTVRSAALRSAFLAGCAASVLMIAGCGARAPVEAPPAAPTAFGYDTPQATDPRDTPADGLLGGPPSAADSQVPVAATESPLKTWRRPDGTLVTAMEPIADPEDSPSSVRGPVRPDVRAAARTHARVRHERSAPVAPARHTHVASAPVTPVRAATPVVRAVARPASKPAPVAPPAPRPVAVAPAPAPLKPIAAVQPAKVPAPAPVVAPVTPAAPAGKPQAPLRALQAAVGPETARAATLAVAQSLTSGQEGQVTLSLPANLGDRIKAEAARLGLAQTARKISAHADLQGQGYDIAPSGRQTAVVKPGQPATFAWQVKPTAAAQGPLKAEFGVNLSGAKPAQDLTLGSIARQVAPIQDAVKDKAGRLKGALPDLSRYATVDVPGVGKIPGKSLLGGALVLLALLILVVISRNAAAAQARAQAERRRRVRTQTDYGHDHMGFDAPRSPATPPPHGGPGRPEHNPFETPASDAPGRDGAARKELESVD